MVEIEEVDESECGDAKKGWSRVLSSSHSNKKSNKKPSKKDKKREKLKAEAEARQNIRCQKGKQQTEREQSSVTLSSNTVKDKSSDSSAKKMPNRYAMDDDEDELEDNLNLNDEHKPDASSETLVDTSIQPCQAELTKSNDQNRESKSEEEEEQESSESELDENKLSDIESDLEEASLPIQEKEYLETNLDQQEPQPDEAHSNPVYNILLLGETGAGKSTTINAFANYLRHSTFEEAITNQFVQLIPSKFTLPNPETGEPFVIQSGSDVNEHHSDGNSNTQAPMGYTFKLADGRTIRIIDTPGMGDTRGIEVDKRNFDKILSYLNYHKQMHGICILIKSNETRKTASFRYCISELLTHLHKSACKNIVFCFTFGRNSFYGPGEGFAILRGFLANELKEVNIELKTGVNCFFIDNEAYRFLVAKKQGYPFPQFHTNLYRESWNKSAKQTESMMRQIFALEPHYLCQTTSLNHARKLMMDLAEPMIQLQKVIHQNVDKIKQYDKQLKRSRKIKNDALPNFQLEVDELVMRPLEHPRTVCTSARCTDVMTVNGQQQIVYKTHCHSQCYLSGIQSNIIGHRILKGCEAFNSDTSLCNSCACLWDKHMHLSTEYVRMKRTIIDTNLQSQIYWAQNSINESKSAIDVLRHLVKEYVHELKVIQEVAAKFGYLLLVNSNTSFNKFIEPYLNKLIDEERKMLSVVREYPRTNIEMLEKMKESHEVDVYKLYESILNGAIEKVDLTDIPTLRQRLFKLKYAGPQFRQMLHESSGVEQHAFVYQEKSGLDLTCQDMSDKIDVD